MRRAKSSAELEAMRDTLQARAKAGKSLPEDPVELSLLSQRLGTWLGDDRAARQLARACNEALAGLTRAHPERFGALAALPFPDLPGCLEELPRCLDTHGFDGVSLLSNVAGHYVGDPAFDPLLAELDRRGSLVLLHGNELHADDLEAPLHPWTEQPLDTLRVFSRFLLHDTLIRYPDIRWVLADAGGGVPFLAERIGKAHYLHGEKIRWWRIIKDLVAGRHGGLELARTVSYQVNDRTGPAVLEGLETLVAPNRVVYGSGYPMAD